MSLAKLQLIGLNDTHSAMTRSVAVSQLSNMTEQLRTNPSLNKLQQLVSQWNKENARLLPLGRGNVAKNGNNYTVVVNWEGTASLQKQEACRDTGSAMLHCVGTTIEV